MIKLLKQYPLIGMIVGALGISFVICCVYSQQMKDQIQLSTLQTEISLDEPKYGDQQAAEDESITHTKEKVVNEAPLLLDDLAEQEVVSLSKEVPVYICGEVNRPGVYYVATDAIIDEVIRLSGGFTQMADQQAVNLASPIIPNEKIIVPKVGEEIDKLVESYDNRMDKVVAGNDTDQSIGVTTAYDTNRANIERNSCININSASKETLMSLPGIGEVKANAIIIYRKEHGSFKDKEELKNVSGIGEKTYEKLAQLITTY